MTTVLPDESAFDTVEMSLPKDHWIYKKGYQPPPMPFRIGEGAVRSEVAKKIREAAEQAIRGATAQGTSDSWDPDALCQNLIVALLGYWSEDGTDPEDSWANPSPLPEIFDWEK